MSSFYVTLPSNSSMKFFPNNTLTKYTTKLNTPLQLEGKYEVALTEIMYPFNFKYRKNGNIILVNTTTNERETYTIQFFAFETISELYLTINDFMKSKNIPLLFHYNRRSHKCSVKLSAPWTMELTDDIQKEFGLRLFKYQPVKIDSVYYGAEQVAEQINSINSFYVYSDIVDYQFVGDAFTPLLRVVPVVNKSTFGEYVSELYTTPHYVPVSRSIINTIEVDIKSDTGQLIQFGSGKLLVKLHFRQVNGL
jgi:hypothetical protein